ncbi:hypothetical protein PFISCL1PPCAC_13994, partial [Pristionchus fissidentatus]
WQTILPVMNSLTLHPFMLFLLDDRRMGVDIRMGYLLTEISLIIFDWIFNFSFRIYPMAPFSGLYCGGPLCNLVQSRPLIMLIISTSITANMPCFLFLLIRMHKHVNATSPNAWNFTNRSVSLPRSEPELQMFNDLGGQLFVFGAFGVPQYF